MQVRWMLAAIAAAVLITAPEMRAQASAPRARPRACAGECPEQKEEALRELARARSELARLVRLMAQRGDTLDPAVLASVRAQLEETMQAMQQIELRVVEGQDARRMIVARVRPTTSTIAREGWLGVSFSSSFQVVEEDEKRVFRFHAYPVVEAVEPASPARRAGIEVGDVLLAFQQKDLREEPIVLDELLTPGRRLPVLLKRGSGTRTVTVVVGERPRTGYASEVAPLPPLPPTPRVAPVPGAATVPPAPPAPVIVFAPSASTVHLAGAEMARLPMEMREQVGADGGMLVLKVGYPSPAARAGLRDGDVIVRANGAPVRSSGDLRIAFSRARGRSMNLEVVRKRETMTVRMSW